MSRRRTRSRDGLAEHVIGHALSDELSKLFAVDRFPQQLTADYLRMGSIEALVGARGSVGPDTAEREIDIRAELNRRVFHARHSEQRWSLATYLYEETPNSQTFCRTCGTTLPKRAKGAKGRRKVYCGPACRQRHLRFRQKQATARAFYPEKPRLSDLKLDL